MRIAVAGTHGVGKSTLAQALVDALPGYSFVPEPYETLTERGYEFAHPPAFEEYLLQLRQSLTTLRRAQPNRVFERCPLDLAAYILADPGADRFDLEAAREPIRRALLSLDLIITLHPDPAHDPGLPLDEQAHRLAVDDLLRDLVADDEFALEGQVDLLTLEGPWDTRLEQALRYLQRHARSTPSSS